MCVDFVLVGKNVKDEEEEKEEEEKKVKQKQSKKWKGGWGGENAAKGVLLFVCGIDNL